VDRATSYGLLDAVNSITVEGFRQGCYGQKKFRTDVAGFTRSLRSPT